MTNRNRTTTEILDHEPLVRARIEKLERWRRELNITGYGHRVEGLVSLAEARSRFDHTAHEEYSAALDAREECSAAIVDSRPRARVAGRCVQHRVMGRLVFLVLRDATGDLQVSVAKSQVAGPGFALARKLDYGDIVVAQGPVGRTHKGEICVWADELELHAKSLVPPPDKFHGISNPELRHRQRYVEMYANPETIRRLQERSRIVSHMRSFMDQRGFLEVETPMMHSIAGGAAARPFATHHNALDLELFLRVAPELYLKRLLVGGMPRVYEVGRNFRNEGIDRSHNPEFTAMEAYEGFGDCWTMLDLTESLLHELAARVAGVTAGDSVQLPFGDLGVDWSRPFDRITYEALFVRELGFEMTDETQVRREAAARGIHDADDTDPWLLVNALFEAVCEPALDPRRPTFVTDYPSAISPLTRPLDEQPHLCGRWELLVGGMEVGTAYTELNDPEVQLANFTRQLSGADEEETTVRTIDEDFLYALRVGMPPAGGLGLGVDRIVMLLTDAPSIRDAILFPLMRPKT